jgi:GT2 family glycosyltransferase
VPVVVAVPVCNEAERIGDCLRALALQDGTTRHAILAFLNNCDDGTAAIVEQVRPSLPCALHIIQHEFTPSQANAGHARRAAMDHAAALAGAGGVILTTDADGRVGPDWISNNLAAIEAGADAVCGRAIIDPLEAAQIPDALHADDALECAYADLLDEIHATLDPDPADPWPRHTEHSGASIAVTCEMFRRAGGVPAVPIGEDRALLDALRRIDARIRHAPDVSVVVSGRTVGRAAGGMADTMRRRMIVQDALCDDRLESAAHCATRAWARGQLRLAWSGRIDRQACADQLAAELRLDPTKLARWMTLTHFGAAWELVGHFSPVLAWQPVARAMLAAESAHARRILATSATRTPVDAGGWLWGDS